MLAHQMLQRIAAQPISPDRGEERIGIVVPLAYPGLQQLRRVAPKRCAPLLPALADATDMRTGSRNDVATARKPTSSDARRPVCRATSSSA